MCRVQLAKIMKITSLFVCFIIIFANVDHCAADVPKVSIDFIKAVGFDSIYLGWTIEEGSSPVEKYSFQYIKSSAQGLQYYSKPIEAIYNDEVFLGLENGTGYQFGVVATNSMGNSQIAYSEWITTLHQDPDFTPKFMVQARTSDSITIRGAKLPTELRDCVHSYSVMASSKNDMKEPLLWTDIEKSYVIKNLSHATSYQLKVAACNGYTSHCGKWSDQLEVSTPDKGTINVPEKSEKIPSVPEDVGQSVSVIWPTSVAVVVLLVLIMVVWLGIQKYHERARMRRFIVATLERFNTGALDSLDPELEMAEQAELLPYDKKWEFPRELLKIDTKVLGSGAFGVVKKAQAKSICRGEPVTTVAVKYVRSTASLNHMTALTRELKILAHLGKHINIVNLLGACTKKVSYGQLLVIVEFCRFGNLRSYLMRRRADFVDQVDTSTGKLTEGSTAIANYENVNDKELDKARFIVGSTSVESDDSEPESNSAHHCRQSRYYGDYDEKNLEPICTRDLLCWAWQVSRGMKYLGTRRVLHGDLAARNILLADNNVVKICDFGLAKALYDDDHYKKTGQGPLPVKWMAIEAIRDRMFSVQSDVWSYGIVLWEFFTLAETPYPGIENGNVYGKIAEGYRLPQPRYATQEIYQMMLSCWDEEPSKRPSFETIVDSFDELLEENVTTHYLDLDAPYLKMNAEALGHGEKDLLTMRPSEDTSETIV